MRTKIIVVSVICLSVLTGFSLLNKTLDYSIIRVIDSSPQNFSDNLEFRTNDLEDAIDYSLDCTLSDLSFVLKSKNNNSVSYISKTKEANCIGYSNYFNSVLSQVLEQNKIKNVEILHVRAKVLMNGFNVHSFFDDPSFKDHDISVIKDKQTGNTYYVDASLSEVMGDIIIKK